MDKIIEALNEVVLSNQVQIKLMREELKELKTLASAAKKQADSSWELVLITRNQVQEELTYLQKPVWKKWFGIK